MAAGVHFFFYKNCWFLFSKQPKLFLCGYLSVAFDRPTTKCWYLLIKDYLFVEVSSYLCMEADQEKFCVYRILPYLIAEA